MDMTWPFIIFLLLFALAMPLTGPYIQKMGPKKVGMIGGALVGIGWFAASYATSPFMLIPLYGVIGGLGVGIAYGCPIAVSAAWFPDKRGLAVGLTVLGFGFSSALITQINKFLLAGWHRNNGHHEDVWYNFPYSDYSIIPVPGLSPNRMVSTRMETACG